MLLDRAIAVSDPDHFAQAHAQAMLRRIILTWLGHWVEDGEAALTESIRRGRKRFGGTLKEQIIRRPHPTGTWRELRNAVRARVRRTVQCFQWIVEKNG